MRIDAVKMFLILVTALWSSARCDKTSLTCFENSAGRPSSPGALLFGVL